MIFITNDNIVEVSEWALRGIEIFGNDRYHEILNPIFSVMNGSEKWKSVKDEIAEQIIKNKTYVDLRKLQLTEQDLQNM